DPLQHRRGPALETAQRSATGFLPADPATRPRGGDTASRKGTRHRRGLRTAAPAAGSGRGSIGAVLGPKEAPDWGSLRAEEHRLCRTYWDWAGSSLRTTISTRRLRACSSGVPSVETMGRDLPRPTT